MTKCSPRHIFVFSKPVVQILLWATSTTFLYYSALHAWPHVLDNKIPGTHNGGYWIHLIAYTALYSTLLFYPVGGFVGDVYLGRYKAVMSGLLVATVCLVSTSAGSLILYLYSTESGNNTLRIVAIILLGISFVLLVIGLSIFNSNVLQFGLDQLMEKPSESLGVFVHWLVWAIKLGETLPTVLFSLSKCQSIKVVFKRLLYSLPSILFALFIVLFSVAYCTRRHFNRDRVKYNPYKMIFRVLNFARKHKYPVGPVSAFAYCYGYQPSRLDYAKERYGGPFTTSDVEDVKSFKNVFFVLLALGPIFISDVPMNSFFYSFFHKHVGDDLTFGANASCENEVKILFSSLGVPLIFPVYMWLIYSVLRNRTPKILHRIIFAAFLKILALSSMWATDFFGHLALSKQNQTLACMFVHTNDSQPQTLHLHWTVEIFPSFVSSFSHNMLLATAYEFISAQSPYSMKGVLVGSGFAMIGTFEALGVLLTIPFSMNGIWRDSYLGHHPPVVSCAFGYYIVCISVALVGLVCFMVAAKRYKYRRRDEEPYSQACVEEIFARRIENRPSNNREEYEQLNGSNMEEYWNQ